MPSHKPDCNYETFTEEKTRPVIWFIG